MKSFHEQAHTQHHHHINNIPLFQIKTKQRMTFMSEQSSSNYPTSIPLHVSSIDSRSGAQNGKKKSSGGKKGSSKKKTVDCPIFLQSKFHSTVIHYSFNPRLHNPWIHCGIRSNISPRPMEIVHV